MAQPSMASIFKVFSCIVGQKPSKEKYYLDDTVEVMKMLQGLAAASDVATKSLSTQVAFENFL
jgi:trehalose 6-phosphate synthase/phosphatase